MTPPRRGCLHLKPVRRKCRRPEARHLTNDNVGQRQGGTCVVSIEPSSKLEVPLTPETLAGAGMGAATVLLLWLTSAALAALSNPKAVRTVLDTAKSFAVASLVAGALAGLVVAAALRLHP
jgi:hypothetical protein